MPEAKWQLSKVYRLNVNKFTVQLDFKGIKLQKVQRLYVIRAQFLDENFSQISQESQKLLSDRSGVAAWLFSKIFIQSHLKPWIESVKNKIY